MGTIYTWKTGDVGDWNTAADWGGGVVPNSANATVVISGTGSDVTIGYGESFTVAALTLGGSTATLDIQGTLAFAGTANTLSLKTGLLEIQGELANADIVQTGGSLVLASATLSGDTYSGTLNVDIGYSNYLYVQNGITSSGGVINLSSADGSNVLYFVDSETFDNQTIKAGNSSGSGSNTILDYAGTLTLGAHAVVSAAANSTAAYYLTGNFVNQGLVTASAGGIVVNGGTFVNAATGTLAVASGTVLNISGEPNFANAGLVSLGSHATLYLDTTSFVNTGAISLGASSTIDLQTSFGLAALGTLALASTATFEVDGTLNLGGDTLDVKTGTAFGDVYVSGGTLENGFIEPDGGTLNLFDATLDAISYSGTLNVTSSYGTILYIENGITATGGVINLVSPFFSQDQIEFLDSETFDTQTIQTGGTSGYSNYIIDNAGTLTLGQHAVIAQGTSAAGGTYLQGNFVNRGLISAASSEIYIYNGNFTNAATGTIAMASGTTLEVTSETSFVNAGLISIGSNATFDLGATAFSNSGHIIVGAGGTFAVQGSLGIAALGSLTLASTATLEVDGTLDLGGGTLDVKAGTAFGNVYLNNGTLANGFLKPDGGTLNLLYATFDAISYSGTLSISDAYYGGSNVLNVENGIAASAGVINLYGAGYGTGLNFLDSETINNQTIVLGGSDNGGEIGDQNGTLTLGPNMLVTVSSNNVGGGGFSGNFVNEGQIIDGSHLEIDQSIYSDGNFTNSSTGTISATFATSSVNIDFFQTVSNAGLISDAGGTLEFGSDGYLGLDSTLFNSGTISIGSGGTLDLGIFGLTNTGIITLASGSTLEINSSLSLNQINSIEASGNDVLDVTGTLDLGGGTLDVKPGAEFPNLDVNGGMLAHGTVLADGGGLAFNNATLNDITYSGTLNISGASNVLYVENGLTAAGGVINLTDPVYGDDSLQFLDSETLNSQAIVVGESNGYAGGTIYAQYGTLTLGANTEVLQGATTTNGGGITGNIVNDGLISVAAGQFNIFSSYDVPTGQYDDNFVNAATGTIAVGGGGQVTVLTPSFTNAGLITAASGDFFYLEGSLATNGSTGTIALSGGSTLSITGNTFNNLGLIDLKASSATISAMRFVNEPSGTLTGGTFEIEAGSALVLPHILTTDAADIILSGTSSTVLGNTTTLEHSLTSVTSAGILQVLGGRNYAATGTLTDAGQIVLGGGSFSAVALTIAAGGTLSGFGTVGGTLVNNGLITAAGGDLRLNSLIAGSGALAINAGATLELAAGTAETVTFGTPTSLHGTLKLDAPAAFTGTLAGLALGDVIDIGGSTVTATSFSGTSLLITLSSGTTLSEKLGAALPTNERFGISGDGGTGSDLTLYQEASYSLAPTTIALQAHVGDTVASDLTIANTQPSGFTEGLDASFSSAGAGITAAGSITTLAAGATNSTALQITLNTAAAGSISSSAVVTLASDGAGTDGQSPLSLGSQTVAVSGAVFNYATGAVTAGAFGQYHVGAAVTETLSVANTAAPGIYSEGLDASFSGTSGAVTASGGVTTLAAGGTNGTSLVLTLSTGAAGVQSGGATISLASDGAGIDTLATTSEGFTSVAVAGTIFNYATASTVAPVNFGIVHVGQTAVSQVVVLNNTAAPGLYSENLDGSFSGTSASITTTGTVSELAAGSGSGSALNIGLQTGKSGVISGFTTLNLTSDGSGIDTLGTTALAAQTVAVTGTVDAYASVGVSLISGPGKLGSGPGGVLTLNLGSVVVGSAAPAESLGIENTAKGTADLLKGTLALSGTTSAFTNNSAISFSGVGAGSDSTGHTISLHTGAVGTFTETIVLSPTGYNSSGYAGTLAPDTFVVTGTVTAAPSAMTFVAPSAAPPAATPERAPLTGSTAWLNVPDLQSPVAPPSPFDSTTIASPASTGGLTFMLSTTALSGFMTSPTSANASLLAHELYSPHAMLWAGS